MREKDSMASSPFCYCGEERVARIAGGGLNGSFVSFCERTHVGRAELKACPERSRRIDMRNPRCRASAPLACPRTRQAERLPYNFIVVLGGEFFDKARIGITRPATQLMIQVADDQSAITSMDQPVEQRDGIASAGNADQVARVGRETAKQLRINLNPIHFVVASNSRCPNMSLQCFSRVRQKDQATMKSQTTYTLLVRSEEKNRDLLEAVVYALCILSAIVAIWQFVDQSSRLSVDRLALRPQPAPVVSHHAVERPLNSES